MDRLPSDEEFDRAADAKIVPSSPTTHEPQRAGPLDINRADMQELVGIPGIGPATALKIIDARQTGLFHSLDELVQRGILRRSQLRRIRDSLHERQPAMAVRATPTAISPVVTENGFTAQLPGRIEGPGPRTSLHRSTIMRASFAALVGAAALIVWALSFSYSAITETSVSPSPLPIPAAASASSEPREGTASGLFSPGVPGPSAASNENFDEVRIGDFPMAGWSAQPNAEVAGVVAFPTAMDRSLRIAGAPANDAVACLDVPSGRIGSVVVELLVESTAGGQAIVELIRGDRTVVGLVLIVDATNLETEGSTMVGASIEADRWYRLSETFPAGGGGSVIHIADSKSGRSVASLTASGAAQSGDRLCFTARATPTRVRFYLDSVRIDRP